MCNPTFHPVYAGLTRSLGLRLKLANTGNALGRYGNHIIVIYFIHRKGQWIVYITNALGFKTIVIILVVDDYS